MNRELNKVARGVCGLSLVTLLLIPASTWTLKAYGQQEKPLPIVQEMQVLSLVRKPAFFSLDSFALSPDGKLLAFTHNLRDGVNKIEKVITVWDIAKDNSKFVLRGHSSNKTDLAFSADGKALVSSCNPPLKGNTPTTHVVTWDLSTGQPLSEFDLEGGGRVIGMSSGGKVVVTRAGRPDPVAKGWNLATNDSVSLEGHSKNVGSAKVSPDGKRIASWGYSPNLIMWEFPSGKKLWSCDIKPSRGFGEGLWDAWAFSPDSKTLVLVGERETLFFDVATGKQTTESVWLTGVGLGQQVAFTPDGRYLAFCSRDVKLWSIEKKEFVAVLRTSGERGTGTPMFTADGKTLVTGNSYGVFRFWELPKLEP
jgi:WD40 repeat protein